MNAKLIVCCFLAMIVLSMAAPQLCGLDKYKGSCKDLIPRYYFNKLSKKCEEFNYGGCGGNVNNFQTLVDCEAAGCAVANSDVVQTTANVHDYYYVYET